MNTTSLSLNEPVGYLRKTTLVDFPARVACAVFLRGCNLRCPYCYNKNLVQPESNTEIEDFITLQDIYNHLELRKNVLSGIVISGGEPLLHSATPQIITYAKHLGYKIKLDTNGTNPTKLKELLNNNELRPDFIAMDIKTSPSRYNELSVNHSEQINYEALIKTSIQLIENHQTIQKEYRTVLVPTLITNTDIENISKILPKDASWNFSNFENFNCLNSEYNNIQPYSEQEINNLVSIAKKIIKKTKIR